MNKIIKKTLKIVLPILLGGFILYWVYRDFDFERAKEVLLHGTDWGWMLLSLLFGVMSHVLRGWRWSRWGLILRGVIVWMPFSFLMLPI